MPRFYFDLSRLDELLPDDQGVCVDTIDEAIFHARTVIDEMRDTGEIDLIGKGWCLSIRTEVDVVLASISID
ncbi:DUF6894 family protein [Methylobacterium crusticola]|uniref:DUF6894 family protein n=1 Tax=Methylobacterium crusticola TaxID=1697972 RepID=UPI00387EC4C5